MTRPNNSKSFVTSESSPGTKWITTRESYFSIDWRWEYKARFPCEWDMLSVTTTQNPSIDSNTASIALSVFFFHALQVFRHGYILVAPFFIRWNWFFYGLYLILWNIGSVWTSLEQGNSSEIKQSGGVSYTHINSFNSCSMEIHHICFSLIVKTSYCLRSLL